VLGVGGGRFRGRLRVKIRGRIRAIGLGMMGCKQSIGWMRVRDPTVDFRHSAAYYRPEVVPSGLGSGSGSESGSGQR
jgi:hypothetical protein